jgi:hypothetical protein
MRLRVVVSIGLLGLAPFTRAQERQRETKPREEKQTSAEQLKQGESHACSNLDAARIESVRHTGPKVGERQSDPTLNKEASLSRCTILWSTIQITARDLKSYLCGKNRDDGKPAQPADLVLFLDNRPLKEIRPLEVPLENSETTPTGGSPAGSLRPSANGACRAAKSGC